MIKKLIFPTESNSDMVNDMTWLILSQYTHPKDIQDGDIYQT